MPGDHLRRWSAKDGVTTFRKPCNKSNGLAWDNQGRLIVCEHASSHLTRTEADGAITVLASHYEGKELNSPNDVVVKSDGAIYFSDPTYGRKPHFGVPRETELAFRGVYRVSPDGKSLIASGRRFRTAQRALLLARREGAVRQRYGQAAHTRVRREARRDHRQ